MLATHGQTFSADINTIFCLQQLKYYMELRPLLQPSIVCVHAMKLTVQSVINYTKCAPLLTYHFCVCPCRLCMSVFHDFEVNIRVLTFYISIYRSSNVAPASILSIRKRKRNIFEFIKNHWKYCQLHLYACEHFLCFLNLPTKFHTFHSFRTTFQFFNLPLIPILLFGKREKQQNIPPSRCYCDDVCVLFNTAANKILANQ